MTLCYKNQCTTILTIHKIKYYMSKSEIVFKLIKMLLLIRKNLHLIVTYFKLKPIHVLFQKTSLRFPPLPPPDFLRKAVEFQQ